MVSLSSRGLNIHPAPVLDIGGVLAKPASLSPTENLIIRWVAALLSGVLLPIPRSNDARSRAPTSAGKRRFHVAT